MWFGFILPEQGCWRVGDEGESEIHGFGLGMKTEHQQSNKGRKRPCGYYAELRPEMIQFVPEDATTILDVGCGEGYFGYQLKKLLGAEVWGVELNRTSAVSAQEKLDNVLIGDVVTVIDKIPGSYFDCVIFNDILEHLVDPVTILIEIRKKLARAGLVVSSIPNVRYFDHVRRFLLKKEWTYEDSGILDRTHLRFFTKKSVVEMFQTAGYEVLKICGINPTKSRNYRVFNLILLGSISDMKYLQFACVARPQKET